MNIAILSTGPRLYSTRRLKEAGEKRGHRVEIIDHMKCVLYIEKQNPVVLYQGRKLDYFDAIIPRIGASVTFYGAAVVRQFEMMKVFTAVESQALIRSRDKLRSLQILSRAGLGLPKTIFMDYSKDTEGVVESVGGAPVVIKLLEGTQGLGVVLAENKKAAQSVIEAFHGLKTRIIVQEFIKEAKGADIRAFIVDGEVVGAMRRQAKEGEFRSNLHRGGTATVVKLSRAEKHAAITAAKKMGLGVAGVDMLPSKRGPLILEVNSSPGLEGIEGATKVDIAGKIFQYLEKNAVKKKIQKDKINA
ncbi:MAG TPA: 30S ribosomal protein S6--L-glutamate ligase [Cyclobacteriaceae bacterium]|jgi:ribosomal protein S6--L-glutamate ligase|nr:30S ribosomal protein S6--L-glutamate ligase [Cyclobacteriaceae bacterium]MBX7092753.1 30S ribosomal protein S6--L-glutamate ligase [Cyclobacteriaceae bacterium]TXH29432.1 MAG: 30S ribosomal protein S6--L-glutamate ligase [Cyclobacteriaceae bacterium]HMV08811.1 30S ribosomal protein S6--L-glutamate ligase [Cyclobacteriaceae bacterium]HMV90547.1 30S ribosomal protein S6--L-glutamate ligase [Cyclobacteriaceae bacterium]